MFRHVVMFRWSDDADPAAVARAFEELDRLPGLVPSLSHLSVGADAHLAEGNFDAIIVADFDDSDDYLAYADHPEHLRVVSDHLRPLIAERVAVQYTV